MSALFWVGVGITTTTFASIVLVGWFDFKRKPFYLLLLFAAMNLGFVVIATQVTTFPWVKLVTAALFTAGMIRSLVLAAGAWAQQAERGDQPPK